MSRATPWAAGLAAVLLVTAAPHPSAAGTAEPPVVRALQTPSDDEATGPQPPQAHGGDCGWSAPLGDGQALWVVCDPFLHPGGGPANDISNSVGIVDADDPAGLQLQAANFIDPAADLTCLDPSDTKAVWVLSLSSQPLPAGRTRVLAFFRQGCRDEMVAPDRPDAERARNTYGVAQWVHDPADAPPSPATPIKAEVLADDVWLGGYGFDDPDAPDVLNEPYGRGSVVAGDHVHAYSCAPGGPHDGHPDKGTCTVARADLDDDLGDPAAWAYWTGAGWEAPTCSGPCTDDQRRAAEDAAVTMDIGVAPDDTAALGSLLPNGFRVQHDEQLDLFVASSRRNGANVLQYRVADRPEGPWSAPADLAFACDAEPAGGGGTTFPCYHNAPHVEVSADATAVLTYYDRNYDGDGNVFTGTRRIRILTVPVCVEGQAEAFTDVPARHPFRGPIDDRADACVLGGFADRTFRPSATITRGAMVTFLWRHAGFDPSMPDDQAFADVDPTHPFFQQAGWAAAEGLTGAFPGTSTSLGVGRAVPRGQLASLLWRLHGQPSLEPGAPTFADAAAVPVRWAAQEGLLCGYADGRFRPTRPVTRQAAAAALHRAAGHPATCT